MEEEMHRASSPATILPSSHHPLLCLVPFRRIAVACATVHQGQPKFHALFVQLVKFAVFSDTSSYDAFNHKHSTGIPSAFQRVCIF